MKKLLFILLLIIPFVGFGQDWEVFFGGPGRQYGGSVQQTSDGGYVFCGYESGGDIHLVKIDSVGNQQWNQIFVGNDGGNSVKQTNDGGYIICGGTTIIKTDVNGNFQWSQSYGTTYKTSIEQTNNGGYIISGVSYDTITNQENIILIKTDNIGNQQWSQIFQGGQWWGNTDVKQTYDLGYIITGTSVNEDMYLIKTDLNGILEWNQSFGGTNIEHGNFHS